MSKRPGQEVRFHCLRVVTCLLHSPRLKDRRNLKKVSLAKRPERRSRVYRSKARRNIVKIISPSYITSFLQQNRSIAMITILLNVNIQYLLHFQINWFLIYFTLFPKKNKSTGTNERPPISVRRSPAGGAASLSIYLVHLGLDIFSVLKSSLEKSKEPPSADTVLWHLSVDFFIIIFFN